MDIIPVIDLKGGSVVRALGGRRETYLPIVTPLAKSSAPQDVVAGLLALYPFRTIYVADLDAIEVRGNQDEAILAMQEAFPSVTFWVDAGLADSEAAQSWLLRHSGAHLVLGSESLPGLAPLETLAAMDRVLLSLDFRGDRLLAPDGLLDRVSLWPQRVIVMTLSRVGSGAGPDIDKLAAMTRRAQGRKLYAAGGVRGMEDLERLRRAGISGALVASALHGGKLTGVNLAAVRAPERAGAEK